jgi:apolipoprotein N-acyltransferase
MSERPSSSRLAVAVGAGALLGLSHPFVVPALGPEPVDPTGLSGLLVLVAFAPLLVLGDGFRTRHAWGIATLGLWTYFVIVAHWLVVAFSTFGGIPLAGGVAMMLVMALSTAAYLAVPVAVSHALRAQRGWPLWLTLPPGIAGLELVRNYVPFGGCPWGNFGNALASVDVLRQGAALVGVYGLVFVVVLVNAALAEAWLRRGERAAAVRAAAIAAAPILCLVVFGAWWLGTAKPTEAVSLGLLQASVPQEMINAGGKEEEIQVMYQALQDAARSDGADLVVWPEAALVPAVERDVEQLWDHGAVNRMRGKWAWKRPDELRREPRAAIIGAINYFKGMDESTGRLVSGLHTSAFITGERFTVVDRYDKTHLVPFGEYVPWPFHLVMGKLISDAGEVFAGAEVRPVRLPLPQGERKVGVTICYEGVFPEVARELAREGATQLYNLTNDAWYGVSGGPFQHLAYYQLRAVETGLPVARAANSGVSALIDARGRILARTKLNEHTALTGSLPVASGGLPPYALLGDWLAWLSLLVASVLAGLALPRRRARDEAAGDTAQSTDKV